MELIFARQYPEKLSEKLVKLHLHYIQMQIALGSTVASGNNLITTRLSHYLQYNMIT
jgi:hypothetical protein